MLVADSTVAAVGRAVFLDTLGVCAARGPLPTEPVHTHRSWAELVLASGSYQTRQGETGQEIQKNKKKKQNKKTLI